MPCLHDKKTQRSQTEATSIQASAGISGHRKMARSFYKHRATERFWLLGTASGRLATRLAILEAVGGEALEHAHDFFVGQDHRAADKQRVVVLL